MAMAAPKGKGQSEVFTKQSTGTGCLVRICWLLLGNVAILIAARVIALHKESFWSPTDLAFWIIVAGMIAIRYLDISKLDGLTATGEPASMKHWKVYSLLLTVISLVIWGLSHFWAANR
jgi:hypothetical protein